MSTWSSNMALIWPIVYNYILIILTLFLIKYIKGKNTKPAFLVSIFSLLITSILTITALLVNIYANNQSNPYQPLTPILIITIYSLPTFFLISAIFSTIYQDRHAKKSFQKIRFVILVVETFLIYGSVFYVFLK